MSRFLFRWTVVFFLSAAILAGQADASEKALKMSTTTSTENSGLLDVLLPVFTQQTGIRVKVFAKGTGAALRDGMDGNVDIIMVHAREQEEAFLKNGYGAYRLGVMHNDFLILGPEKDPAGIRGMTDAVECLKKIANAGSKFVSRGDGSGTHLKEQSLWEATGFPIEKKTTRIIKEGAAYDISFGYPKGLGEWYVSIGQGMGKTLSYADEKHTYVLSDRGTFLKYKYARTQGLDLEILCQGDPTLYNPYGVIPISPKKHPHVQFEWADKLARWLVSKEAQNLIANYKINGYQAFFPDAVSDRGLLPH